MAKKFTKATHTAITRYTRFDCVPLAEHLNHDGRPNGISRVQVVASRPGKARIVDVGTKCLHAKEGI